MEVLFGPGPAPTSPEASVLAATLAALTTLTALLSGPQGDRVQAWTNREGPFEQHSLVKTYVRTAADAYIAVVRVDTDGRLVLLFPYTPDDDAFARGGRTYQVQGRNDGYTFTADDPPGIGYLLAVASPDPLRLEIFEEGGDWHLAALGAEHIEGDPYTEPTEPRPRARRPVRLRHCAVRRRGAFCRTAFRLLWLPPAAVAGIRSLRRIREFIVWDGGRARADGRSGRRRTADGVIHPAVWQEPAKKPAGRRNRDAAGARAALASAGDRAASCPAGAAPARQAPSRAEPAGAWDRRA
jgi:hypothetical protein